MIILEVKLYFKCVIIKNWDSLTGNIQKVVLSDFTGFDYEVTDNTLQISGELSDLYQAMIILTTKYKVYY